MAAARYRPALAYDAARERVVLYGGWDTTDTFGETWEFDGSDWTQAASELQSPPARSDPALTYDEARGRVVLFGGNSDVDQLDDGHS